jgi:hypothetical protein
MSPGSPFPRLRGVACRVAACGRRAGAVVGERPNEAEPGEEDGQGEQVKEKPTEAGPCGGVPL